MSVNRVILALGILALVLVWLLDVGTIQPNRIVSGTGHGLLSAVGWSGAALVTLILVGVILFAVLRVRGRYLFLLVMIGLSLALLPLLLEVFAGRHLPEGSPYARSSVGAGFWCLLFLLSLMLIEVVGQLGRRRGLQLLLVAVIGGSWLMFLQSDGLESLSLVREFHARPAKFEQALWTHLALAFGAVGISVVLAFGLALKMIRSPAWQRPILGLVSFLQTIPSLAVFGLLIAPLSALVSAFPVLGSLGIRGIGWAPALLALVAYSLLPMVRNTFVALTEVPEHLVDAGRGMGMNERQLFFKLKLPLALPVMIEGVRITTIQAIGLTAVAALIGAGGFGSFIFQGLGQAAMDLVLLGALPTIVLALLADALLTMLAASFRPAAARV
ncbi:binding-protein-dependent transport system inner membrane protein [Marinobacter santoriniensis NKSG1]|uniref:Binding-protein-dependent transport system inner membrane protein n=1 Tax=Marinobacter santoriniensis NKSG1 TaxID=1288826 RepID=M7CNY7_9GAMM|nr:ABC transporter permease [Marinobacter santoriniensis]EMP54874.1 binding-protein-dependent transport system inner membrane protein [Marinobacter santoriniensis NKSG1]